MLIQRLAYRLRQRGTVVAVLVTVAVGGVHRLCAQQEEAAPTLDRSLLRPFSSLSESMNEQRWREEYASIERAVDNLWRRNGWSSEADRFARNLACEMTAIPPWDPMKRIQVFNDRVAARYGLKDEQALQFQGIVMREAARFMMQHGGVVLSQMQEGLQQRASRQPFAPEQIARWTQEITPLMNDLRESVDRVSKEVEPLIGPEKAQALQRDLQSFNKRRMYLDQMATKWSQGQWQPIDWGLQDDPIQSAGGSARNADPPSRPDSAAADATSPATSPPPASGAQKAAVPASSSTDRRVMPPRVVRAIPHEPPTWFSYVLDLQQLYRFDAAQMSAAESIHDELFDRAQRYIETHAEQLETVAQRDRPTHEAYEPIRQIYTELQVRLDAIPTSAQREQPKE